MKHSFLWSAGLTALTLVVLAACGGGGGSNGAQFQFGQAFSAAFGSGTTLTGDPVAVADGDAGALSLITDPIAVQ